MVKRSSFGPVGAAVFALVAAISLALMPRPAAAQDAAGFIANLGSQAMRVLGTSVPEAQREAQFRRIFTSDFDLDGAARFVVGPYWNRLSPEQQQQFLPLFADYMAHSYSTRLNQYAGAAFHVTSSRPNGGETIVSSQVQHGGKPIEIDWHVLNHGGRFLITDVYVDGVSMKVTHRQEFAGIIQRNGGRPDALLAALRQEVGQAVPQVGSSRPAPAPAPAMQYQLAPANQYQPVPAYGR